METQSIKKTADVAINPTAAASVKISADTDNRKLGNMATTSASQSTCPLTCKHLNNGCYAGYGPMFWSVTSKLNKSVDSALTAAKLEAKLIDSLPADRMLRLHVVGDCASDKTAKLVSAAASRYIARGIETKGTIKSAYTYTHAWQNVARESWRDVSVLASCESIAETKLAADRGYAAAIIVEKHQSASAYDVDGMKVIPCPYQTRGIKCDACKLCANDTYLRSANAVIAFEPHGAGSKKVRQTLITINMDPIVAR